MDYKQEMFYRMPDQNMSKIPFYMAYPMQTVYLEEAEYARDMQKLKNLYSKDVQAIQAMVEDECDKMEYDGSLMFDEYPDKLMLNQIVGRIYDSVAPQKLQGQSSMPDFEAEQYEDDMQAEELPLEGTLVGVRYPDRRTDRREDRRQDRREDRREDRRQDRRQDRRGRDEGLQNLIEVLLFNEMHQRRCRHKRCRRWW